MVSSEKPQQRFADRAIQHRLGRNVNRRALLKGGTGLTAAALAGSRIASAGAAGSGRTAWTSSRGQEQERFDGVTLRVFTQTGPFISGPIKAHAPRFEEEFGARVDVIESPNAELFAKAQQVAVTGTGEFDVLLLANTWMPDFVNLDYAISLDPYIEQDLDDPLLAWDDIPDGIKLKNSWGGQTYTWIVDNDNQTMFYRKDVLDDPRWQEEYLDATGNELPNPPQTLPEFIEVAKFFTGKDWGDVEGDKYGFITCVLRGQQSYWYSYPWTAPYSVVPADQAPARGIYIFDPDMNPLINNEGYVRGLTEFVEIIREAHKPGLDSDRAQVITEITQGRALMSLDWGDTGPASVADDSLVKGKIGFALTPGVTEYFDWQTDTWVTVEDEPHRTPTHAYNGWSYYITSQTEHPEAAWAWIKWHSSPEISAVDVASPDSGYQPWRDSHSENLDAWLEAGWDAEEAELYIQTILDTTNHPNAVFDPRIPGAARYQEILELHTNRAIAGEAEPQAAMDECVRDFNNITDELGRDSQIAAYRAHLGME